LQIVIQLYTSPLNNIERKKERKKGRKEGRKEGRKDGWIEEKRGRKRRKMNQNR